MNDAPERIWIDSDMQPWRVWTIKMDFLPEYVRADLPAPDPLQSLYDVTMTATGTEFDQLIGLPAGSPEPAPPLSDPRVTALVEAVKRLGLRDLVADWNGEKLDKPYAPHSAELGATIKTTCGVIYAIDAALEAAKGAGE